MTRPRIVRNFWLESVTDDGRRVGTGPRARDGGMDVTLYQRDAGEVREALSILCRASADGTLTVTVRRPGYADHDLREVTTR